VLVAVEHPDRVRIERRCRATAATQAFRRACTAAFHSIATAWDASGRNSPQVEPLHHGPKVRRYAGTAGDPSDFGYRNMTMSFFPAATTRARSLSSVANPAV
jgi:hypothetical protein